MARPFKSVLKSVDRNTTKAQWHDMQRWLRTCDRKIHNSIDYNGIYQASNDLLSYGIGIYPI